MTTAMESKEEISDTDSGIILHSGPDSPTSPVKDLTTHTRALKLKHQALEDRLELCLLELRKLCIREAELTGKLPSDYPLLPEEKAPHIRRRIGASFKLDQGLIQQHKEDVELQALETDLAVQRQICEAARRLSQEEHLRKPQKKNRLQQCKREEKKVKDLQEAVFQHRIRSECSTPRSSVSTGQHKDASMSDDSSLSDVVALDDDVDSSGPLSPVVAASYSDPIQLSARTQQSPGQTSVENQRSPIQNSPWKESSLDQPYQKPQTKPNSVCSSRSSSPAGAPVCVESSRALPSLLMKNVALLHTHSTSAPSTPELHIRRQYSQSFRLPKSKPPADMERLGAENNRGRPRLPQRRCVADLMVRSPEYSPRRLYQSSSEDSSSEHSVSSYTSSPGRDGPTEMPKLCPPPYGFHFGAQKKGPPSFPSPGAFKNNNNNLPQASPAFIRPLPEEGPLSPQDLDMGKCYLSSPPVARRTEQKPWQEGAPSPRRTLSAMKPPPPYTRLVRTPSLKEYPNHAIRLMPREMVSEELKSWHQRNQLHKIQPSPHNLKSPTSARLTAFHQGSGNVVLQRAVDGTPLQWFVAEDAEIVSQV
ncbi:innate immunity activator protein [Genypterus blacodes]|uniref:innate immunity activator protein n=1 Tax=Genypterus blacodes TaxID=154954 RepID=UPI003F77211D